MARLSWIKPGRVQRVASSQVGVQNEEQGISSSKAPTAPGKNRGMQRQSGHAYYLGKLVQNVGVNILGGEQAKYNLDGQMC